MQQKEQKEYRLLEDFSCEGVVARKRVAGEGELISIRKGRKLKIFCVRRSKEGVTGANKYLSGKELKMVEEGPSFANNF